MTNAQDGRANARAMPTDRRAFLAGAIAAGASAVPAGALAAPAAPDDPRMLDLWRRYKRVRQTRDRFRKEKADALARMPAWARPGPKHLSVPEFEAVLRTKDIGWPAIEGLAPPKLDDGQVQVLSRPNHDDLISLFREEVKKGTNQHFAARSLAERLQQLEDRCLRQEDERHKSGLVAAERQAEEANELLYAIEGKIEERMMGSGSPQAVAAAVLYRLDRDYTTDDSDMFIPILRILRPKLSGTLAEDADAALAKANGRESA